MEYHVFLKQETKAWSQAERRVFTPSGSNRKWLHVTYTGLEVGTEYEARVYARNAVAFGVYNYTQPVAAPGLADATVALSSLTLTGVSGLDFVPHEARYVAQVEPGVTQTTIEHEPVEEGATSEVTMVRLGGKTVVDTEDADPDAAGHQARLSGNGDTLALVTVTAADGLRQDAYRVTLEQQSGSRGAGASRQSRSTGGTQSLSNLTISYGDRTVQLSQPGVYRRRPYPTRLLRLR